MVVIFLYIKAMHTKIDTINLPIRSK
jgi:hypothetical protein